MWHLGDFVSNNAPSILRLIEVHFRILIMCDSFRDLVEKASPDVPMACCYSDLSL